MPMGPDYGASLAARAVDLVAEVELAVLRTIAGRLGADMDAPEWGVVKLAELQMLRRRLQRDLAEMDASLAEVAGQVMRSAYTAGKATAVADLDDARVRPSLPPAQERSLLVIVQDTVATLSGVGARALRSVVDAYQETVAVASSSVVLGGQTRRQAAQGALDRLLGQGIIGFRDSAGRDWRLESYVEMATRSGAGQAAVAGHLDLLQASGQNLVQIIPGPRACPICDDWAGKVVSLTSVTAVVQGGERVKVHGTMDAARRAGVFHPNCRCTTGVFIPGVTRLRAERPDPSGYEVAQRQRAIERGIRDWKRREAIALSPEAKRQAAAKVREWQGRMREHLAENPTLRRQSAREQIGRAT